MLLEGGADVRPILEHPDMIRILARSDHQIRITTLAGRFVFASNGKELRNVPQPEFYRGRNAYDLFPSDHSMMLERSKACAPERAAILHVNPVRDGAEAGWMDLWSQIIGKYVVTLVRPATTQAVGWECQPKFIRMDDTTEGQDSLSHPGG